MKAEDEYQVAEPDVITLGAHETLRFTVHNSTHLKPEVSETETGWIVEVCAREPEIEADARAKL
jgi:hypothetical protein